MYEKNFGFWFFDDDFEWEGWMIDVNEEDREFLFVDDHLLKSYNFFNSFNNEKCQVKLK